MLSENLSEKKSCAFQVVGTVTSWLVCLTLEGADQFCALAQNIVLCSWARHFTLTVPLSTQVYKWELNAWGNPAMN